MEASQMIAPKARTQSRPIDAGAKGAAGKLAMMPDAIPAQDRIRERAYQLYESRGREPGQDEQDWLLAEQEILKRKM
jgi:hypothetical protein